MIDESQLLRVLASLHRIRVFREEGFSSHDVIQEYCRQYEIEYLDWLMMYRGMGHAFQTVHKQIGRFLSKKENMVLDTHRPYLTFERTHPNDSECVHGTIDRPMWWRFV